MQGPPDWKHAPALGDPYPGYAWLRHNDPVHWSETLRAWVVTRYDDVLEVFDRPARFSSDRFRKVDARYASQRDAVVAVARVLGDWMAFRDPPDHTRLRALLQKSFTTKQLERTRPQIDGIIRERLDQMGKAADCDFVRDFAFPLPAGVIAVLLGVPASDIAQLRRWSDQMSAYVGGSILPIDNFERTRQGLDEMCGYFRELIRAKKRRPDDALISMMLAAEDEGDRLSEDEVVSNCVLLLFAGHETTTNLLANGLWLLLEHPDQMDALRARPSLLGSAIEEFLRFEAPVPATNKVALEDFSWHGSEVRAGDKVLPFIAAANRDPAQFEEPDRLDIARQPNRHLAFTYGIHFCLGAPLARLEAKLGFEALLGRFPTIEHLDDRASWKPLLFFRALEQLRIRVADAER
jgi:cytochrome P450